jgi:hypothetical protein
VADGLKTESEVFAAWAIAGLRTNAAKLRVTQDMILVLAQTTRWGNSLGSLMIPSALSPQQCA